MKRPANESSSERPRKSGAALLQCNASGGPNGEVDSVSDIEVTGTEVRSATADAADEEADRIGLMVPMSQLMEKHGRSWFMALVEGLLGSGENRGRHLFGKTAKEHLSRRIEMENVPLYLRLVDLAKVHGKYLTNRYAPGFIVYSPTSDELLDSLFPGRKEQDRESQLRGLRRALQRAKKYAMVTFSSRLNHIELMPGEWCTRKETLRTKRAR